MKACRRSRGVSVFVLDLVTRWRWVVNVMSLLRYTLGMNLGFRWMKFIGLQIDSSLNWKMLIEYIIPKLSSTCLAVTVT
jgi:hypothetical protein